MLNKHTLNIFALLIFWAIIGAGLYFRISRVGENDAGEDAGESIEGLIVTYPYEKDGLQVIELRSGTRNYFIRTGIYPQYLPGDYIAVDGVFDKISLRQLYYPDIKVDADKSNKILRWLALWRSELVEVIQRRLPEPHASLTLGMLLGYRADYPPAFYDIMRTTGVLHIIVVSGYNVSLVLGMIAVAVARFGRKNFAIFSIGGLLVYVILTGLDPPIIRAAIMGAISIFAMVEGRLKNALYVLVLSAALMILVDPLYLTSISFQMTFAATSAVIGAGQIGGMRHQRGQGILAILLSEGLIISAANLTIIPITSHYFGTINFIGILTNLLIFWMVPFITILGFVLLIVPAPLSPLFSTPLIALIDYFLMIIKSMPQATIEYIMKPPEIVLWYAGLIILWRIVYLVFGNREDQNEI